MEPEIYEGIVMNMPAERIPIALARETLRVGSMTLWQYQHFLNHEHLAHSMADDPENTEMSLVAEWREILSKRFPSIPFVIEVQPAYTVSWFQATKGAPTEDDPEWTIYMAPIHLKRNKDAAKEMLTGFLKAVKEDKVAELREEHKNGFEAMTPRKGGSGTCELCEVGTEFTEPEESAVHRGLRITTCKHCGARLIHSRRTIRESVNL